MEVTLLRPLPPGVGRVKQWFGDNPAMYAVLDMAGHNGLDYGVVVGTPVLAANEGIVQVGDDPQGYGRFVRVINGLLITIYAHMSEIVVAHNGHVDAGQQIGVSGNTGWSSAPHLHFGLKFKQGRNPAYRDWCDPVPFRV